MTSGCAARPTRPFVRSPYAHATINGIDTAEAQAAPGVIAILTGADVAADGLGALPCGWMIHSLDGSEMKQPPHPVLAADKVNYAGEPVAMVVAETRHQAKNAAEQVLVDYAELPAVVNPATAQSSPQIHAEAPDNTSYRWGLGEQDATAAAMSSAAHIVDYQCRNNRLIPNAMEPRAAIADFNPGSEELTLYTTSQNPHLARLILTAFVQIAPEHKLRVIAPDVGGGFGSKIYVYSEESALAWASKKLKLPIKWTAERGESFLTDAHGRDHVTTAKMGLDDNGRIVALQVKTIANMGAYLSHFRFSRAHLPVRHRALRPVRDFRTSTWKWIRCSRTPRR